MSLVCLGAETGMACNGAWLIVVFLFFAAAILRKQIEDFLGMEFSLPASAGAGILVFIVVFFISQNHKLGLAVGLITLLVAGFLLGPFLNPYFGGSDE